MVLEALSDKVDQLIVGGGIAITFLAAAGKPVGKSLCETDLIPAARELMKKVVIPRLPMWWLARNFLQPQRPLSSLWTMLPKTI